VIELVLLVGLPGAGKSTFFRQRFASTHVQVSKDVLRASGRSPAAQSGLVRDALAAGRSVVVDNTNATLGERAPLVAEGRRHGARVVVYRFEASVRDCIVRNAGRQGPSRIADVAIFAAAKRMVPPTFSEGFDAIYVVRPLGDRRFEVRSLSS
jgi:predicted kinase